MVLLRNFIPLVLSFMQMNWVTYTLGGHIISEEKPDETVGLFTVGPFKDFYSAARFVDWSEVTANWN